jgi:hypothetical protein
MANRKRYLNLEKARAAKAEKRSFSTVEFPTDIQLVKHCAEGWVAQGELPIDGGGHFLVQGLGNTPEQALADMRRAFEAAPFTKS